MLTQENQMNQSHCYTNSLYLIRLIGYELICVDENLFHNIWAWTFDLTTEQSYPADYNEQQVSILTVPSLYESKNFGLTRQVLSHGLDYFPKFEHWLKTNALHVLLDEKILTQALNKLIFIARRELETSSSEIRNPKSDVGADLSVGPSHPQETT